MEDPTGQKVGRLIDIGALAKEALQPELTDTILLQHRQLFTDICARWIQSGSESRALIAGFGRILPLAPHVAEHADHFLAHISGSELMGSRSPSLPKDALTASGDSEILETLLGAFRLLSYDCRNFAKYVQPLALRTLFQYSNRIIQYVAVRAFCLYVHAADHATQEMINTYLGEESLDGPWEGQMIDYRFLSLWEEQRWKRLQSSIRKAPLVYDDPVFTSSPQDLTPYSLNIGGVLLPRLDGIPSSQPPAELISTATTERNLISIAKGLLQPNPLLIVGLAGSAKSLLIRHLAWQLNKLDKMVTLHLNEQSDAKLLIGMYATGAKPGTFSWRPGVLTTAVREGRWIFVEDLDRAPNEVISILLPLIERGEMLIPGRGETVHAAKGFRIIATMTSTLNSKGQEIIPRQDMIGHRLWSSISIQMPPLLELRQVVSAKFPVLQRHLSGILGVYSRLLVLTSDAKLSSENGVSIRAITPRDLFKWCDRIATLLARSSTFGIAQKDDMFLEALDCFAGSMSSENLRLNVMSYVAEELHIDPQRRDFLLRSRSIQFTLPAKNITSGTIQIGRAKFIRHKSSGRSTSRRPFSTNDHTLRLMESISVAVDRREPLLLVGETGTGKTTCIQYLAEQFGRKLVVFNLSQQSESGDLLGGFKPVNVRSLVVPLKDEFDEIFDTTFSRKKNSRFLEMLGKRVAKGEWNRVCTLWREALKMVDAARSGREPLSSAPYAEDGQPKKKRRTDSLPANFPKARWDKFAHDLQDLEAQLSSGSEAFAFSFLEGNIVKAIRNGDWILLDEINLASPDTLEALTDLFCVDSDGTPSILLTEIGSVERLVAHPNFRVFAAMNPATDVGKKDLPPGIRSRFTELYVESPDKNETSLCSIIEKYLIGDNGNADPAVAKMSRDVARLYLEIQRLTAANMLVDGADQKPHFSLRTLTRTLSYAREVAPLCSLRRALYEGFHMSFLTFLAKASEDIVTPLITNHLFPERKNMKAELGKPLQFPSDARNYVRQGHYWLRQGVNAVEEQPYYIITPFVQRNMNNLMRAASTRKYPVLIQGPTSSGKTSMIEYLAKRSGNTFVRINNHEHTDLQEYLGSYVSGVDGKLSFQEGILVRALREGHWIVLDELNLAPTDVLEALNRLLDDNRELLIPETQEVVHPHEDFMLFATQNPAGLYGGRKVLSRAFRNRFLELHFDDIPVEELTEILHRRTMIPETWCKRIVRVYRELSILRQENRIFEQKSFATLRDLFRWAHRKADTVQDLANDGYMLLAERVRKEDERLAIKRILEAVMSEKGPKVIIDEEQLFNTTTWLGTGESSNGIVGTATGVVWTGAMRRLFVLVAHALRNSEPVLLVGETGCGKTTVCQLLADHFQTELHIVNAHQNTETGDLIGAQRPIRNRAALEESLRVQVLQILSTVQIQALSSDLSSLDTNQLLDIYDKLLREIPEVASGTAGQSLQRLRIKAAALFEWADGSLVQAMKEGQYFLLDEISLAEDSVLERLNSVLESSRTLLLAEKGPNDPLVTAIEGFQFLATMNPGGDYGKKELSPALRNRFTEIWVPPMTNVEDILQIVRSKLKPSMAQYAGAIVSFSQWFNDKYNTSVTSSISIRDTLAWVSFINKTNHHVSFFSIVHGAAMVFIDTLGANPAGLLAISQASIDDERRACLSHLGQLIGEDVTPLYFGDVAFSSTDQTLQLGEFSTTKIVSTEGDRNSPFSLEAPTTRLNAMRVVRALQLEKPILLEGNPGVGKTSLVTALARLVGKKLVRLNLSEQTDLMDLFGSDIPAENGAVGEFAWRDAPFLQAMKNGDWVLLDEMNLASQSVLEGLNAVLDHRGEVYISELDQKFYKNENFRAFAAQNPHHQGGGRKGLPASFVNRFTVVYADVFRPDDLEIICHRAFPTVKREEISELIQFVAKLDEQIACHRAFGNLGAPWEFNLRDTLRWLQLLASSKYPGTARDFLDIVFLQRMRTGNDRERIESLFLNLVHSHEPRITFFHNLSTDLFQVGSGVLSRDLAVTRPDAVSIPSVQHLAPLEAMLVSVQNNWPLIVVGSSGSGKTTLINKLASFVGANLITLSMNPDIDAMDLVGGYEQLDPSRAIHQNMEKLRDIARQRIALMTEPVGAYIELLENLQLRGAELPDNTDDIAERLKHSDAEVFQILKELQHQSRCASQHIDGARFQWVDGILVRSLEQGNWLVLDNANLCSSAVLDRLNSLLEPNGYLSINEHSLANGEAQIVKPHPNFRIFMTMDPKFGELSRAMRNRAVEICLLPSQYDPTYKDEPIVQYPLDSATYRFRHFKEKEDLSICGIQRNFENLGLTDIKLIKGFAKKMPWTMKLRAHTNGVCNSHDELSSNAIKALDDREQQVLDFVEFLSEDWALHLHHRYPQSGLHHLAELVPCHPLVNELSLNQDQMLKSLDVWYSSMYDILLDLHKMRSATHRLPSAQFERHREKQKLPSFLYAYVQVFGQMIESIWLEHRRGQRVDVTFLKPIQGLFWGFLLLATTSPFDRAKFQSYVSMLTSIITSTSSRTEGLQNHFSVQISKKLSTFGSAAQLTTGMGMERMWRQFKPATPVSQIQLNSILELESLADRLDTIMWKSDLVFDQMVQIRERMASSLHISRQHNADTAELIVNLESAVCEVEKSIGEHNPTITPYFEEEFEGFSQLLDIASTFPSSGSNTTRAIRANSTLLARRPTKLLPLDVGQNNHIDAQFAKLSRYLGLTNQPPSTCVVEGRFHIKLIAKLYRVDEIQLRQLDRLETELRVLSQGLSLQASRTMQDHDAALDRIYHNIYDSIYLSHHQDLIQDTKQGTLKFRSEAFVSEAYRSILYKGFTNAYRPIGAVDARAWVELGIFGLHLYVPNYPHDPALKPQIEREMFMKTKQNLLNALDSLCQFQVDFTGQKTSFRVRQVQQELQNLGEEPPLPAIYRPEVSQLEVLQGEFDNLLSVIQPILDGSASVEDASHNDTLRSNLFRIIQRLTEGYREYDDITDTVVGFVVCLSIGLLLARKGQSSQLAATSGKHLAYVSSIAPFFGRRSPIGSTTSLLKELEEGLIQNDKRIDFRKYTLFSLSILKKIDPISLSSQRARDLLHNLFASFFGDWKTKLLKEQEKEAERSSLYTFKGMEDETSESDPALFPDYEAQKDENQSSSNQQSHTRDFVLQIANIHSELFLDEREVSDSIKALLDWCTKQLNNSSLDDGQGISYNDALPAIFIMLDKKKDSLSSSVDGMAYNFYFDANLAEAKFLTKLIHRIQLKYRQIQNVWPEHATLGEVLRTCEEALEFRYVDPVAKFITKAEKLHSYMYEWEKVASKQYSTAELYDDLTKLLISWRKLELTTWAKLFDVEVEKCRKDAQSWFFVAYETIIAASESIEQGIDASTHAINVLQSLESFFENTTLGQFEQRVKLLQQFRQHAAMRMQDMESFKSIHIALDNYIGYIARFEGAVGESIAKGRQGLEREVKDVIKLASWKDTNIDALKQSAKTSHRKLTKLVRKFRALLNQSISNILKAEIYIGSQVKQEIILSQIDSTVDRNMLEICSNNVAGWSALPSRFKNTSTTISLMQNLSVPQSDNLDGSAVIDEFVEGLLSSITQLRKETPSTLTDENKATIQQLKAQKRKLYADTMKSLRNMGIQYNLSMDILAKQENLSIILSSLPLLPEIEGFSRSANSYLHNVLNNMPRVRAVHKEHSSDLTPNDVAKSIGYLEGLLHTSLRQRRVLSKAVENFQSVQVPVACIANLCRATSGQLSWITGEQYEKSQSLQPRLRWLTATLKTGANIVSAQARLGKTHHLERLIIEMRDWTTKLGDLTGSFDQHPNLPINVQSELQKNWDQLVQNRISEFRATFEDWVDENEMSRSVLRQIEPFLFQYPETGTETVSTEADIPIESHMKQVFDSLDLILGSIQDVSIALKDLPSSTEDLDWLVKEEEAFSRAINALHASHIDRALQTILSNFQKVHSDVDLQIAVAVLVSMQPIFDQYTASYKYLIHRFEALHISSLSLLHQLSKSFLQVGTQGFCQPQENSAAQEQGKDEKLESGTGLGQGEGAEDISKDIDDTDDLEELAQEKGGEREGSIEEEDDAVDMGEQDMEGETGEKSEKQERGDDSGEEGDDDVQSEVGSVDDHGPSAVDEKMWDDGTEQDDAKDKEGKEDVGTENQNQEAAAEQEKKEKKEEKRDNEKQEDIQDDEDMEMEGEDQEENVGVEEPEQMDPHAKEAETLELPEDLNMDDQNDDGKNEDEFGDMDMGDDLPDEDLDHSIEPDMPANVDEEVGKEQEDEEEEQTSSGHVEADDQTEGEQDDALDDPLDDQAVPLPDDNVTDNEFLDTKDTNQPDPNADTGAGAEAKEQAHQHQNERASANAANQDEGQEGEPSETENRQEASAKDGNLGQTAHNDMHGHGEEPEVARELPAFKKLGDVLEKWYNQQKQISEAREKDQTQVQQIDKEIDMADAGFEHLANEEMQPETQAIGSATEDQAKALDHDMALPMTNEEDKLPVRPDDHNDETEVDEDIEMKNSNDARDDGETEENSKSDAQNGTEKAFIGEPTSRLHEDQDMEDAMSVDHEPSESSSVHEVETQLEYTHLDNATMTSDTARSLWVSYEAATHSLSQQLTEHLRLILAPTLATKLRGDFRTGKRLNLKRIIPYIASGYKRDKIWLRRSQPSKRSYQIMIALDDSKSMAESGASSLALKTLTLVTKSLSMLEVGEVSVVGFGDEINVAHDFDKPFTSDAGVQVFEQFGFDAAKTNVKGLVEKSLELFGEARRKGASSRVDNLWQLMLIVSDGICDSHAEIQRLVRKAQEERVMIVFIIIDSSAVGSSSKPRTSEPSAVTSSIASSTQVTKEKETASILDLQSVEITPEGKVVRWKYMERFPFRYYLIVRDVRELPSVLAGALRQWFGEVAGTA